MGPGTQFAFQHDVRVHPGNLVTVFDDGAGPPTVHNQSRALLLRIDTVGMTASLAFADGHRSGLLAQFDCNDQLLPGGDNMVGWGQQPYFTQYNAFGQTLFDARFVDANTNYRAYRFPWTGAAETLPAVAVTRSAVARPCT